MAPKRARNFTTFNLKQNFNASDFENDEHGGDRNNKSSNDPSPISSSSPSPSRGHSPTTRGDGTGNRSPEGGVPAHTKRRATRSHTTVARPNINVSVDRDTQSSMFYDDVASPAVDFSFQRKVTALYKRHAPEKVANLEQIFCAYVGFEETLWQKLVAMYLKPAILQLYEGLPVDSPQKKSEAEIDALLVKYIGKEDELLDAMEKKLVAGGEGMNVGDSGGTGVKSKKTERAVSFAVVPQPRQAVSHSEKPGGGSSGSPSTAAPLPIAQGWLEKYSIGRSGFFSTLFGGNWKRRYFLLNGEGLSYFKEDLSLPTAKKKDGMPKPLNTLPVLDHGTRLITKVSKSVHSKSEFPDKELVVVYYATNGANNDDTPDEQGKELKLLLRADSKLKKDSWCDALSHYIRLVDVEED